MAERVTVMQPLLRYGEHVRGVAGAPSDVFSHILTFGVNGPMLLPVGTVCLIFKSNGLIYPAIVSSSGKLEALGDGAGFSRNEYNSLMDTILPLVAKYELHDKVYLLELAMSSQQYRIKKLEGRGGQRLDNGNGNQQEQSQAKHQQDDLPF